MDLNRKIKSDYVRLNNNIKNNNIVSVYDTDFKSKKVDGFNEVTKLKRVKWNYLCNYHFLFFNKFATIYLVK